MNKKIVSKVCNVFSGLFVFCALAFILIVKEYKFIYLLFSLSLLLIGYILHTIAEYYEREERRLEKKHFLFRIILSALVLSFSVFGIIFIILENL